MELTGLGMSQWTLFYPRTSRMYQHDLDGPRPVSWDRRIGVQDVRPLPSLSLSFCTDEDLNSIWPDSKGIPVGLGALANRGAQGDPESEEDELATQPARKSAPKKSKKVVKDEEEDELEGDDSEVDDTPVVAKARSSRRSTAKVVADDDEDDDMYE